MKKLILQSLMAIAFLGFHLSTLADDTDLFVGADDPDTTTVPNVLFIVDNTANWSNAFDNEMAALASTLSALPVDTFRIGIMFSTEQGNGNSNTGGGYLRAGIRLMDSTNKAKYQALVNSFTDGGDRGSGGKSSLSMAEAYRYFSGGEPYAGNGKVKADFAGNHGVTTASDAVYALPGNPLDSENATSYNSPVTSGCQKNFIIYISNGPPQDNKGNKSGDPEATSQLAAAGGDTGMIKISPTGSAENVSDEWARFMKSSSLGVVTYTIDVDPITNGQNAGWTALLKSMASVSKGKYFAVDSDIGGGAEIADAINNTLSEIQAVNSVFAAVSLPVSVNTQGTYLNQVYVGMFRPDASDYPRWVGNLKQYKMGFIGAALKLEDADSNSAVNSQTGFITECARSYWTPTTTDSYWGFSPSGKCLSVADSSSSNYPDGNVVEKGAQAYKLRSTTTRTVKTCSPVFTSCTALTTFDTANSAITESLLGAASADERTKLINWAYGIDVDDENINENVTTEMRPSSHGDVVHSRPVAINFGTDDAPQIVVFYGGNDGMLRAINGNRSNSITSGGNIYAAGSELWAFVAPESYTNFKRLHDNSTKVSTPTIAGSPKPYAFDGPITAYKDPTHAWIYATMRRGGRVLYAFDVTTPGNPSLKWKVGCPNNFQTTGTVSDVDCTSGFSGIGQTWSSPKTLKASGYGSGASPLLIMGGGYDTCEDADPNSCTSPKGNEIYVMDADTGELQQTLATDRSVVGDIVIVPDSITGLAKYAYAADLGGNIYRIDIGINAPASWTITKIASLGCDTTATCPANRKFMFAPDVVEENGVYNLLIGSGDREKPLNSYSSAYSVSNYFFMVKDKPSEGTWLSSESDNCDHVSVICKASLLGIAANDGNPSTASLATKKGWYLGMAAHEQVVTSAITLYGLVTFSTHQPATVDGASCGANLGTANVYNINYTDASGPDGVTRFQHIVGDGLPPSPVAGKVTLENGQTVPFVIGASPDSPLETTIGRRVSTNSPSQPRSRVYWYIQQ